MLRQIGDLLKDWRRINVAFTRAKSKLIIFGSRKTLQTSPVMVEFFHLMDEKGWILDLKAGADSLHEDEDERGISNVRVKAEQGVLKTSEKKRGISEVAVKSENMEASASRNVKKAKIVTEEAFVRSRPILRDILNGIS